MVTRYRFTPLNDEGRREIILYSVEGILCIIAGFILATSVPTIILLLIFQRADIAEFFAFVYLVNFLYVKFASKDLYKRAVKLMDSPNLIKRD